MPHDDYVESTLIRFHAKDLGPKAPTWQPWTNRLQTYLTGESMY